MLNKLTKIHTIGKVVGSNSIKSLIHNELQRFELLLKNLYKKKLVVAQIFSKPDKHWGFGNYYLLLALYVFVLNRN